MMASILVWRHLGGAVLLAAALLTSSCAAPTPVKTPTTLTPEEDTAQYTQRLREQIKKLWGYPCVQVTESNCEYKDAELDVEISLLQSGELHSVKITRSSGIAVYDSYALNAVRLGAPYPPVPETMMARGTLQADTPSTAGFRASTPLRTIRFSARFKYVVDGRKIE
jgi:TonB family protein